MLEFPVEAYAEIFLGEHKNAPKAQLSLGPGGMPPKKFFKLHSNIRDFSALRNHFQGNFCLKFVSFVTATPTKLLAALDFTCKTNAL